MPDEFDPSRLFVTQPPLEPNRIDTDAVVKRARRRRAPVRAGIGVASVLAVALVIGGAVYGLRGLSSGGSGNASSASSDVSSSPTNEATAAPDATNPQSGTAPEGGKPAANGSAGGATQDGTCGGTAPEVFPSATGFVSTVKATAHDDGTVTAVVTLTDSGPRDLIGDSLATTLFMSKNGIVVWHSDAPKRGTGKQFILRQGESITQTIEFTPTMCVSGDDRGGSLPNDLPALSKGAYALSARSTLYNGQIIDSSVGPKTEVSIH